MNALAVATSTDPNINKDTVAVMAPYFASGADKGMAYPWTDGLKANKGSTTNALVWSGSQWVSAVKNIRLVQTSDPSERSLADATSIHTIAPIPRALTPWTP